MPAPLGKVETTHNGPQSRGIHGGDTYKRTHHEVKPNAKAQTRLNRRIKDFKDTVEGQKGFTRPGSLNRANR